MANTYEDISTDAEFSTISVNYPMTNFVMGHLVETILVIAITIAIALFAKQQ